MGDQLARPRRHSAPSEEPARADDECDRPGEERPSATHKDSNTSEQIPSAEDESGARGWFADKKHRRIALAIGLVILLIGAAAGYYLWQQGQKFVSTANAYVDAQIARVSPEVAGHVSRVLASDNERVAAGQPLVVIGQADLKVTEERAQAELAAAEGQLAQAIARTAQADAAVAEAAANVAVNSAEEDRAREERARYARLSQGAVAAQARENVEATAEAASARTTAAERRVASMRAEAQAADAAVAAARAQVERARTMLRQARLDLADATVEAPITGRVTQLEAEPGDYFTPGQPMLSIVGEERWVEANFKETQLTRMRPGLPVTVTIDAYPEHQLAARVDSIQAGTGSQFAVLPPQNATSNWVETVQRVPVKLVFARGALAQLPSYAVVAPGLSASVKVRVEPQE